MMLALAWLTVSLPFVNEQQEQQSIIENQDTASEDVNPFGNTTEEKTPSNTLSEYLHDGHIMEYHFVIVSSAFNLHNSSEYEIFHPELNCPPPEA
jgi:hypothetical protein